MKHVWLTGACAALLLATPAFAADAPAAADKGASSETHERWTPPKTRQEAIERVQKRLDALKAMSDEEWKKKSDESHERFLERRKKWEEKHSGGGAGK